MYYKAKRIALENGMRYHLCAVVWRKRKPIALLPNRSKGQPKYLRILEGGVETSSHHAETNALRFAKPGDVIEVLRWGRSGEPRTSQPCEACQSAMRKAGIAYVIYTNANGEVSKMFLSR